MTDSSQFPHDEGLKRCDGCDEPHAASELHPIWDGSIQVCEKCYAAATAMFAIRIDS